MTRMMAAAPASQGLGEDIFGHIDQVHVRHGLDRTPTQILELAIARDLALGGYAIAHEEAGVIAPVRTPGRDRPAAEIEALEARRQAALDELSPDLRCRGMG